MTINLEKGQNLFFTSDTHFGHRNICRGVSEWTQKDRTRDFSTVDKMNDAIVNGINNRVMPNDILIHLGDWSFGGRENIAKFRDRINCQTIHLVLGNHDERIEEDWNGIQSIFTSVQPLMKLKVVKGNNKYRFFLFHYPVASWIDMNQGVMHLHGHVHLSPNIRVAKGKAMDVGVDGNNLEPISLMEVVSILEPRPINCLDLIFDHHIL